MVQIKSRSNTINVNPNEIDGFNEILSQIQIKAGIEFSNLREIFNFLTDSYISPPEIIADAPAESSTQEIEDLTSKLAETEAEFISVFEELQAAKVEISTLKSQPAPPASPSNDLGEFQLILSLTPARNRTPEKKLEILREINKRRNAKFQTAESISDTINVLIFQDATIFNFDRSTYTGF